MKRAFVFIITVLVFSGCLKLDQNLYNHNNEISGYLGDDYNGEQDFVLDASYSLPPSAIHRFTLQSNGPASNETYKIHAVYLGDLNRINSDTVILYCHGNKWHMDFYWQRAKLLAHVNGKLRYGLLMMDYRGYGLSEGEPSEEGLYADVRSCLKWLQEKGMSSSRLIVYGFSMGSAPACEILANPGEVSGAKLILEAPFASSEVMVQDAARLNMPASFFTDLKVDNAEKIKKVSQPLLWIHGTNDNFLSYKTHGEVVYKNHGGTVKEQFLVDGADHGEVPEKAGFENYLKVLRRFIQEK